jgi:hypothetical protein
MAKDKSMDRLISLLERQIAIQLHLAGTTQDAVARILQKSKHWVNDLVQGLPKGHGK